MSVDAASSETSLFSSVYQHKRVSAAQLCCFRTIQSALCCAVLCVVILTTCIHPMVTGMHCDVYLLRCITWHYGQGRATPSLDFPNERQDSPACPVGCRSRHTQGGCILYRHFTRKIVRSLWRRLLLLVSCRHPGSTHSSNTARAHCSVVEGRRCSHSALCGI